MTGHQLHPGMRDDIVTHLDQVVNSPHPLGENLTAYEVAQIRLTLDLAERVRVLEQRLRHLTRPRPATESFAMLHERRSKATGRRGFRFTGPPPGMGERRTYLRRSTDAPLPTIEHRASKRVPGDRRRNAGRRTGVHPNQTPECPPPRIFRGPPVATGAGPVELSPVEAAEVGRRRTATARRDPRLKTPFGGRRSPKYEPNLGRRASPLGNRRTGASDRRVNP